MKKRIIDVDRAEISMKETADEILNLNFACPHCDKPLSMAVSKINLKVL